MRGLPFPLLRAWHLWSAAWVDRNHPPLTWLAQIRDPDRFLWAMLPHAARSFAVSILSLPEALARPAAIAYLHCRALDTLEDQLEDAGAVPKALSAFVDRLGPGRAEPLDFVLRAPRDERERAHRLLLDRLPMLDAQRAALPLLVQASMQRLLQEMAQGMCEAAQLRAQNGGTLHEPPDLFAYCDAVIGAPLRFCARLIETEHKGYGPETELRLATKDAAIFLQLANVTRDLEADRDRSVSWVPALRPADWPLDRSGRAACAAKARRDLLRMAIDRAAALERFLELSGAMRFFRARVAGRILSAFTTTHYENMARMISGTESLRGRRWVPLSLWLFWEAFTPLALQRALARDRQRLFALREALPALEKVREELPC